ncbi:TetR/AcrR family transcriptional regulator [Kineococcus gypseus]|uniref:TetR/AcrR family transcriptional regulator n=1 Tax=Kineococcus gypseus TaxID=1637102 RepID=UPI003D7F0181
MATDPPAGADPRIVRTHRDVVAATAELLVAGGWEAVTHAEVARRSGYSKATVYAHWPTRFDLVRASIERICDEAEHPEATGDLHADLRAALLDFAHDLSEGHLDRLLAGVVEHADPADRGDGRGRAVADLRSRLYETGTSALRAVLADHLGPEDVDAVLVLLTGGVLVHVTYAGRRATPAVVDDLVERVVGPRRPGKGAARG